MEPLTVWVLAKADDPGLLPLATAPAGVTFVTGSALGDFTAAPTPDALFVCTTDRELLERVLQAAPRVRWVHSRFAGLEHALTPTLLERPLPLTNARGVFSRSLAEFVIAGLLYFAKDLRRMVSNQMAGVFEPFDVEEIAGRTLAIVGYGDVGRATAQRARALGMRVLAVRRRPEGTRSDALADEVAGFDRLRDVIGRADDVALALPLTPETRRLVGGAELAALGPTGVLVNVGRGATVDEAALVGALEEKRIKGAALDVFETEPLPSSHAFWRLDNVLLSPHCADHTKTWLADASRLFLGNLARFRRGEALLNVVDKRAGY